MLINRLRITSFACVLVACPALMGGVAARAGEHGGPGTPWDNVPGVVVDHSPASSGIYLGSPGLAVLPDGSYLAKADEFGPSSSEHERAVTRVYRSDDEGRTWRTVARVDGVFWASLFVHRGAAHIMGTESHYAPMVVVRSEDGGATWTEPVCDETGRLLEDTRYHTAPMPVIAHKGRLWRATERVEGDWGRGFRALLMSAPVDADLLRADSWSRTPGILADTDWMDGEFAGWLEGNAVVAPDGNLVNVLRMFPFDGHERAAIITIDPVTQVDSFEPAADIIDFPGGGKKFTIRHDPESGFYWSLANATLRRYDGVPAQKTRNTVVLLRSGDMRQWETRAVLLHHPDPHNHAFQYLDWLFDGEDIIALSRTAHDDGMGGANNQHDANFMTFHRFAGFREIKDPESIRSVAWAAE